MDDFGLVEVRPGVWKSRTELEEEARDWDSWRASLQRSAVKAQTGVRLTLVHESESECFDFEVSRVLEGDGALYLDGASKVLGGRRTYRVDRIRVIVANDGTRFRDFYDWAVNRCQVPPEIAELWGRVIPDVRDRR